MESERTEDILSLGALFIVAPKAVFEKFAVGDLNAFNDLKL